MCGGSAAVMGDCLGSRWFDCGVWEGVGMAGESLQFVVGECWPDEGVPAGR